MKRYVVAVLALAGAPTAASAQLVCIANIALVTFETHYGGQRSATEMHAARSA